MIVLLAEGEVGKERRENFHWLVEIVAQMEGQERRGERPNWEIKHSLQTQGLN